MERRVGPEQEDLRRSSSEVGLLTRGDAGPREAGPGKVLPGAIGCLQESRKLALRQIDTVTSGQARDRAQDEGGVKSEINESLVRFVSCSVVPEGIDRIVLESSDPEPGIGVRRLQRRDDVRSLRLEVRQIICKAARQVDDEVHIDRTGSHRVVVEDLLPGRGVAGPYCVRDDSVDDRHADVFADPQRGRRAGESL